MILTINEIEEKQNCEHSSKKLWDRICKISNIILSVLYALFGWIFGFLGIMFFNLGLPEQPFKAVCSILVCSLLSLIPIFCILGIVFSVIVRKEQRYGVAFLIQFLPFAILGLVVVLFILSVL